VSGGIEEGDFAALVFDLVRADVLGDAAVFAALDVVLRMTSNSEVLPWSTWPSMVTTGGRGARSDGFSSS
jgi:hypothetical protein